VALPTAGVDGVGRLDFSVLDDRSQAEVRLAGRPVGGRGFLSGLVVENKTVAIRAKRAETGARSQQIVR